MARINIEDCWWSDARRNKLIELLKGNSRLADGLMLQAWKLAQNHCTSENGLIPLSQFLCLTDAEALFECDLAVLVQANAKQTPSKAMQTIANAKQDEETLSKCQAYVRGSKQHHDWLVKRRDAGRSGGVKSAKRGRDEGGKLQANTKQTQANGSKRKQSQASSSSSYSYSYSDSSSLGVTPEQKVPAPTNEAWETYRKGFSEKYGTEPVRNAKVSSQLSQLIKRIPSEEVPALIRFFLESPNSFYVKNMHQIGHLLADAEKVYAEMKSGVKITDLRGAKSQNLHQANDELIARRLRTAGEMPNDSTT